MGEELARAVGALPLWLDAGQHDRWVAATSHVPYLLASALALATPVEAGPLLGPGFRSTSRLAGSSTQMMVDILTTNPDHIRAALRRVREELDQIDNLLAENDSRALAAALAEGREAYHRLVE
jgi:prephenate dehydrogenase